MDGTEIEDQIKKAEIYEAVKQALMRLLDDPPSSGENLGNPVETDSTETLADTKQLSGSSIFLITGAADTQTEIGART